MKSVYQPRSVIDVSDAMKVMFVKQLVSVFLAELENCAGERGMLKNSTCLGSYLLGTCNYSHTQ